MGDQPDARTSLTLLDRLQAAPADPEAWAEFVRRYGPKIRAWCASWGVQPADCDEVTQVVLTRLLSALRRYRHDPDRRFRSWLRIVTRRVWIDLIAHRRRAVGHLGNDAALLENVVAREDLHRRLAEAFDTERLELAMERVRRRVAPATWDAFRLTTLEGHPGAEAGRLLGIPAAHVFVAKHRVQKLLKEELEAAESMDIPAPPRPAATPPAGPIAPDSRTDQSGFEDDAGRA
jgi:RNA polymerase sigma-70 factor (ECF subfamily)